MSMTLTQLVAEVQALTGRENDSVLITAARVTRWLNEAQSDIVNACRGHLDLDTSGNLLFEIATAETVANTTWNAGGTVMTNASAIWKTAGLTLVAAGDFVKVLSGTNSTVGYYSVASVDSNTQITLNTTIGTSPSGVVYEIYHNGCLYAGVFQYDFSSITPEIQFLREVFYMDGFNSRRLNYVDTEYFDRDYPSPTDLSTGIPVEWTRRASVIEVYPVPTASEQGKYLRLNYTKKPTAFATASMSATCDMSGADTGLVYFAVSEAFKAIGNKTSEANSYRESVSKTGWYYSWLDDYRKEKDGLYLSEGNTLLNR